MSSFCFGESIKIRENNSALQLHFDQEYCIRQHVNTVCYLNWLIFGITMLPEQSPSSVVAKTQIQLSFLSLIVLDVCSPNAEEFDSVAS